MRIVGCEREGVVRDGGARGNRPLGALARPRVKNLLIIEGILARATRAGSGSSRDVEVARRALPRGCTHIRVFDLAAAFRVQSLRLSSFSRSVSAGASSSSFLFTP